MGSLPRVATVTVALVASGAGCGGRPASRVAAPTPPKPAATTASAQTSPSPLAAEATTGVTDPALRELLSDHWQWALANSPVWATSLGDHRYDDRLPDHSQKAIAARRAARARFLSRARAISPARLDREDTITLALFIQKLAAETASEVCEFDQWSVSSEDNAVTEVEAIPYMQTVKTPADGNHLVARYQAVPQLVDDEIANLKRGLKSGRVTNAESLKRTIALIDGELAKPIDAWRLMKPARAPHPDWSKADRKTFASDVEAAIRDQVAPSFRRYRAVLATEILPRARTAAKVGLSALPHGARCYRARIYAYTGLHKTPAELHALGEKQIALIDRQMQDLGQHLFGTSDFAAITHKLRTDRSLYFDNGAEILAAARAAVRRAEAAIPRDFDTLPKADCVVVPIPAYKAPYTTIAYYEEPHPDGSAPGRYFVNTYEPETRPRYEAEVLAYHEAIPGHHLQLSIAEERTSLPAFRRFGGNTAFVEGWALYAEKLADEMGLYTSDLDRMGMLSYEAWRAARLVVDTGIHADGWTRRRAEKYLREHTALTEANIRNEVDRYITWPGQALAYKVGQLEILRLRAWAKKKLGARFRIKAFHDVVLDDGAVTLPVLDAKVKHWVAGESRH